MAARRAVRVFLHTFGCKANQYDTERMRQELEARGAHTVEDPAEAEVCVVNTCTVTSRADAQARRMVRRLRRQNGSARIVVAGCSAALEPDTYRPMRGVSGVVRGHDPVAVAGAAEAAMADSAMADSAAPEVTAAGGGPGRSGGGLVQLELRGSLDRIDTEPVGAELLRRRVGATRGWLKIQDGCDRRCSFCATRLARGASRSRDPAEVVEEARLLAGNHPELVLTGIHIGHYGRDLEGGAEGRDWTLARLLELLLDRVPEVRFRLGSVEATEVDDELLDRLATSGGRVAPHLHMPLQSGADPVLRRMRRWHTREMYRSRALEIVERLPTLGLGADIITGFPGETDRDHAATLALVEELPYTYLHVFPFSPRNGTPAAELDEEDPVPQRVAGERSRELRERVQAKGRAYRARRVGETAEVALEREGTRALTGDYLRVEARGAGPGDQGRLHRSVLRGGGDHLYIDLSRPFRAI